MYRFYNSALYVTTGNALSDQTVLGAIKQLSRVQSISLDLNFPNLALQYLNSKGEFSSVDRPTANITTSYLLSDGANETALGFVTGIGSNILKSVDEEKNLYISYLENGLEPNYYTGSDTSKFKTLSIGNALLTNYSVKADVNSLVQVSCGFQALNLLSQTGLPSGQQIPTVDLVGGNPISGNYVLPIGQNVNTGYNAISAFGGKNITMNFPSGIIFGTELSGDGSVILQGFDFGMNLNRLSVKSLGNVLPKRQLQFPVEVTLKTSAIIDKYKQDQLYSNICNDSGVNFNISLKQNCTQNEIMKFSFTNMTLESEGLSYAINAQNAVDLNWRGYIYNFYFGSSVSSSGAGDFNFEFSNEFI